MAVEFEIKVVAVGGSLRMTVPKEIAKALSLKAKDTVLVSLADKTMLVTKKTE